MAIKRITPDEMDATNGDQAAFNALVKSKIAAINAELDAAGAGQSSGGRLYDVAHLTGDTRFHFNDDQRRELKKFVDAGGTLVVDAAGGSEDFAVSAEAELKAIFGTDADQLSDPLAATNPLFTTVGTPITTFGYRQFAHQRLGHITGPQLRGIAIRGRLAVLYSREDLSAGLVGEPVDGIVGYDPPTAEQIMRHIILSAKH
jgi:hypothetical protein